MTAFDDIARNARSRKLAKDPVNGIIFGVCAGIAWWLGVKSWFVRLVMILSLVFMTGPTIIAYVIAALVLSKRPISRYDWFVHRYGPLGEDDHPRRRW